MSTYELYKVFKVINKKPDFKLDYESLKKILNKKQIRSEIAETDGWMIKVDSNSADILAKDAYQLCGSISIDHLYELHFSDTFLPFPERFPSINEPCTAADRIFKNQPINFKDILLHVDKDTCESDESIQKHEAQVGARKMETNSTRYPQTDLVERSEEETAQPPVRQSTMTYNEHQQKNMPMADENTTQEKDMSIILVQDVPKEINVYEVLLHFKNPDILKGGEVIDSESFDQEKGIKIKFSSPETAKYILAQEHKIDGNVLTVSMYFPSKIEEKQFLIYDITHSVRKDTLKNFLKVYTGIDIAKLKMLKAGSWLVECSNKFDFEKLKTNCRDNTKTIISETYPKVKQVEVTCKIIVRNIPEKYDEELLNDYFSNPLDPENLVSLKMLPGKRCVVTFNDHNIASRWSNLKKKKFEIDLYYDYLDGIETCNEIKLESNFLLDFIKEHKNVFEDELKDSGYPVWSESQDDLLKVISIKYIEKQEIEKKVKNLLDTIFKEELSIPFDILEVQEIFHKERSTGGVYFDSRDNKAHIFSFNKLTTAEYKKEILNIVESKSNQKAELEFPPHKISLLCSDFFPLKICPHFKNLKINKKDKKIELLGTTVDIEAVTLEVYKFLSEVLNTSVQLPNNAEKILNKYKVQEYLEQNLKDKKIICSWEIKSDGQVFIYCSNEHKLYSATSVFKESFLELNFDIIEPEREIMKEEKWKTFLKELSIAYTDQYYINEQQDEKISIVTTREIAQNIKEDFEKFFATHDIYTNTLPMECGFYDYLKTFNLIEIRKFCQDHCSTKIDFQHDQIINISALRVTHKKASDFLMSLKNNTKEFKEEFFYFGFKKFLKTYCADIMLISFTKKYKCIIKKNEDINSRKFERKYESDLQVKFASSFIILHMGNIMDLEVNAIVCPCNRELKHLSGLGKELCEKGGFSIQAECDNIRNEKTFKILPEGGIEVTPAGGLKCDIIIHAVGPVWNDGNNYEYESLCELVNNCLVTAERKGHNSIAFPAISTGFGKFPINTATDIIVFSIKNYLRIHPSTSLKSIYLVSITETIFSSFEQWMKTHFPGVLHKKGYNDADKHGKSPIKVQQRAHLSQTDMQSETGLLNKSQVFRFPAGPLFGIQPEQINVPTNVRPQVSLSPIRWQFPGMYPLNEEIAIFKTSNSPSPVSLYFYTNNSKSFEEAKADLESEYVKNYLISKDIENLPILSNTEYDKIIQLQDEHEINIEIKSTKITVNGYKDDVLKVIGMIENIVLNFLKKTERDLAADEFTIRIQERAVSLPEHWVTMEGENYIKVELKIGEEYNKVKNLIPRNFEIIKIERVQNQTLYHQYKAQLDKMNEINPSEIINETQQLWHGTTEEVTEKINANGFDRDYCVKSGRPYGEGVYFAVNPQLILNNHYSPPNNKGYKKIYMCNVLTGMFCQGKSNIRALPENPQHPGAPFNSAVDNMQNPTMYITFHDSVAYPVYLITGQ